MKTTILPTAAFGFATLAALAQSERYEATTAGPGLVTNSLVIAEGETAQVTDVAKTPCGGSQKYTVIKNGFSFDGTSPN